MWLTAFVLKSFAQSRGFIFIDPKELTAAKDWIIQHQKEDGSFPAMVVSAEVEMTSYALLTYTLLGDVASALPVVKWLSQQRNALGGFSSTQDTCVALQALAEYAILSYVGGVNLTISLASTNLDYQETFELNKMNKKVLQTAVVGAFVFM
ncbi:hypothetical protein llap_20168 [Limosa lapponica baueri]|uniref:Alpha-macroglobulin-like TED domain-containing protein n=1 Tax=Limosa lapponica baueri TaxID=1758121 RepID=A0A2I0T6Y0_LIMLA|nr:hypothetical protein llap_20168 [Limosa lapponica baueri]